MDNPVFGGYAIATLSIFGGVLAALHSVHPVFSILLVVLLWSLFVGALLAFDIYDHGIKYAVIWLGVRVGSLFLPLAAIAYHAAGWSGVLWPTLQIAHMLDSAFLVTAIAAFLVSRVRQNSSVV